MWFVGKIVIVMGVGLGFGEGIVNIFVCEGVCVIVNDLNVEVGECVVSVICVVGGDVYFVQVDVLNGDFVVKLFGVMLVCYGDLYIVVNNVGIMYKNKLLLQIIEDEFDCVMVVNVKSIYWMVYYIVLYFCECGSGVFVNVVFMVGIWFCFGLVWYNVSKGVVIMVSKVMVVEFGFDKICVNCVNLVMGVMGFIEQFMGVFDMFENWVCFLVMILMGWFFMLQDVVNVCLYLVLDEVEFIIGMCLEVDGGCCV